MAVTRKPLTDAERRSLEQQARSRPDWANHFFGGVAVFALVLGAQALVLKLVGRPGWADNPLFVIVPGIAAIAVVAHFIRDDLRMRAPGRARAARMLAAGDIDEEKVTVVDAIEVEESEDEGPHYYLKLGDGRVLFLSGQYLLEVFGGPDDDDWTPRSSLTIRRSVATGEIVHAEAKGKRVPPSTTRPPFTDVEQDLRLVPDDGAIVALPFDSLRGPAA